MLDKISKNNSERSTKKLDEIPSVDKKYRIIACIGERCTFDFHQLRDLDNLEAEEVNFYEDPNSLRHKSFSNSGKFTYVMSRIDDSNKMSDNYLNCTGILMTGVEKDTGKNISFMTHQIPYSVCNDLDGSFKKDLESRVEELLSRVDVNTVDSLIFGGNYFNDRSMLAGEGHAEDYKKTISTINEILKQYNIPKPEVLIGPSMSEPYETDYFHHTAWFDNKNRRLYLRRPEQNKDRHSNSSGSFYAEDVEKESKKWDKE